MSASIDKLTGLLTIQSLYNQLEAAIKAGDPFILIALDLDKFKAVNDKFGHVAGDEWLRLIACIFAEAFSGEGTILARLGGDELAAAVPTDDPAAVYQKAEALRQRIEKEKPAIIVKGEEIRPGLTVSLGLATFPANAANVDDLVDKANQALRRAKLAGGNHACFYQETDFLTGLLNRTAIRQALEEAVTQARAASAPLSIIAFDLDRFKQINDEYGHRVGDEVLKRMGHLLRSNFPGALEAPGAGDAQASGATGIPGRLGGEEFIIILPGQSADSAFILADEFRRLVEDNELPITLGAPSEDVRTFNLRFHVSGGVASFPGDATEAVDLLRKADEALFRSKRTGRNRISLPTSAQMVTKTSYYSQTQLERLANLARKLDKTEAFLLRQALDELLLKYEDPYVG